MSILHNRRKTDQLAAELAQAYRRIGVLYACAVIKPALLVGDAAGALTLLDGLADESTR